MTEYHKIDTVFKRNPATNHKTLLAGEWSRPEFGYLADNRWVFTEKVDGTNIRVQINDGLGMPEDLRGISFGGKTDAAQIPALLVKRLEAKFLPQSEALLAAFPVGACLYGEGYGAKIQKGGGNYRPDQDFVLFDVKVGKFWLQRRDIEDVAQKFGLEVVPIIGVETLHKMVERAESGFESQWGPFVAEGIVARPEVELKSRNGERVITKIKHKDFADARRTT